MKLPYMKFWVGDFTADTLHYDATEIGAYMQLIIHAWHNGGMIRTEDLRRVARVDPREWNRVRARLEHAFDVIRYVGFWAHERVMLELRNANEKSIKTTKAAMQMHSRRRANAHASAVHNHTQLQSELVSTKTVTVEAPGARARSNGSHGAGAKLSQAEQDRLIAKYEAAHGGQPWQQTMRHNDGMSPEKPEIPDTFGIPK